jgi:hypothetical protein
MPRKPAPPSVVERLRHLQEIAAERSHAAREADAAKEAAMARVETTRVARVEAHAAGDSQAIKAALTSYQEAEQEAEDIVLRAEGARLAAGRAQAEVNEFKATNADELIAALEPEALAVTAELTQLAQALVEAGARWRAIADQTDDYLRSHPGATPAADGPPPVHGLEHVLRSIRDLDEIPAPLPRWTGIEQRDIKTTSIAVSACCVRVDSHRPSRPSSND